MRAPAMEEKPSVAHLSHFWEIIAREERKFLALDYDGTLAPFRVGRMEAFPLEGIVPLLEKVSGRPDTTLAVISGRPLRDLQRMLSPWQGIMVGSHGFEKRGFDGRVDIRLPDDAQRSGLEEALALARGMVPGGRLELKVSSIAVHTRGLSEGEARRIEEETGRIWGGIAARSGLKLIPFNRGVELRARGWDKGRALEEVLGCEGAGAFCVYIGDDLTDEDAFRVVRGRGIGIKVGDPSLPTEASGFLPDVPAVRDFLAAWSDLNRVPDRKGRA
jgi:trehalose 6-phosphate phosphatase